MYTFIEVMLEGRSRKTFDELHALNVDYWAWSWSVGFVDIHRSRGAVFPDFLAGHCGVCRRGFMAIIVWDRGRN